MNKEKKNLAESVLHRLKNHAKATNRRTDELLRYFAIERFLYRLSLSQHSTKFFLKGGLMLKAWEISNHRTTLDIDLLGKTQNSLQNIDGIITDICNFEVALDGINYETTSIKLTEMQVNGEYHGVRVLFTAKMHSAKIPMQLDIGFSDLIFPEPLVIAYPTILDFPAPKLKGYTPESVIAEKFEAMMKLGLVNTRMKDFFDIWILSQQLSFTGESLQNAIKTTFEKRQTLLNSLPDSINEIFYTDPTHRTRWKQFLKNIESEEKNIELPKVINEIKEFLEPIVIASMNKQIFKKTWNYEKKWA
jgi:predicted nucleotidyltransferase component of viral defense system